MIRNVRSVLTLAFAAAEGTVEGIAAAGLRDKVKTVSSGAAVDQIGRSRREQTGGAGRGEAVTASLSCV